MYAKACPFLGDQVCKGVDLKASWVRNVSVCNSDHKISHRSVTCEWSRSVCPGEGHSIWSLLPRLHCLQTAHRKADSAKRLNQRYLLSDLNHIEPTENTSKPEKLVCLPLPLKFKFYGVLISTEINSCHSSGGHLNGSIYRYSDSTAPLVYFDYGNVVLNVCVCVCVCVHTSVWCTVGAFMDCVW